MNLRKMLWATAGFILLGIAYLGVILPGLPWSIFVVMAAYCFAKSSQRMHNWLYNHKLFGPFLTNWQTKKVFPFLINEKFLLMFSFSLFSYWTFRIFYGFPLS